MPRMQSSSGRVVNACMVSTANMMEEKAVENKESNGSEFLYLLPLFHSLFNQEFDHLGR